MEQTFDDLWIEIYSIISELKKFNLISLDAFSEKLDLADNEIRLYKQEIVLNKKKALIIHELERHYDLAEKILLELKICKTINTEKDPLIYQYHLNKAIALYDNPNL